MPFVVDNFQILSLAAGEGMGADFYSAVHDTSTFDLACVQCVWTGANSLTLNSARVWVEGSLDGLNWCSVFPDSYIKKVQVADGCLMYSIDAVAWRYQRVFFEHRGCSAGSMSVYSMAKRRRAMNP